jgi:uncharacterized protein (TIGR00725 family)
MRVSVIGGGTCTDEEYELAREVGRLLGDRGHTVVCGGLGGVMAAACEGAKAADGETIGILPTERRADANPHVDTAIATGMGHARNALVITNGDAAIAVDGGGGTLSEVGYAHVFDRPIAGIDTHRVAGLDHVEHVDGPVAAVDYVEREG